MVLKKVSDNILKSNNDSNIYYIKDLNIVIDAGNRLFLSQFEKDLKEILDFDKIEVVILTHLHYDHIGCFDLFPNAKFYASCDAIEILKKNRFGCILDSEISDLFDVKLHDVKKLNLPNYYEFIPTPGHCISCLSIYNKKDKVLFSGDTLFFNDMCGRSDLPTSNSEDLEISLKKLEELDYEILCPGHDY